MIPYFAAETPAGTYHLKVTNDPSGTPDEQDITVVVPHRCYWLPGGIGISGATTIWAVVAAAINAEFGTSHAVVSISTSADLGLSVTFGTIGGTTFEIEGGGASSADDGELPLSWLGWDDADTITFTGGAKTTEQQARHTWFPKCHWDSAGVGGVAESMVMASGRTADGSEVYVDQSDGRIHYLQRFEALGAGFSGARASVQFLRDAWIDWGPSAGITLPVADRPSWMALDGSGGWWQRARKGAQWVFVRDESAAFNTAAIAGEFVASFDKGAGGDLRDLGARTVGPRLGAMAKMSFMARRTDYIGAA